MPDVTCSIKGCTNPLKARGPCKRHYRRWLSGASDIAYDGDLRKRERPPYVPPACSIALCERAATRRGWCELHYRRWRFYGDPLESPPPRKQPELKLLRWLEQAVAAALADESDECLAWPYCTSAGYGQVAVGGGVTRPTHLVVLEWTQGPKPSPIHQGRHLCGNGHLGCFHPRHLAWGTPKENEADKLLHGTASRGERNPASKLTSEDVRRIRASTATSDDLARDYGVRRETINGIRRRASWKWLP